MEEERREGNERPPPYNPDFGHTSKDVSNPRYLWQSRSQQESEEEEEEVMEEEEEEEVELTRRHLRELRLRRFAGQRK